MNKWILGVLTACLPGVGSAAATEIVFIAPTNHAMPVAQFTNGAISGGILKELGDAIAARMGRKARFVSIPSKRVGIALTEGAADLVCYVMPGWIDGEFKWSRAFIPNEGSIVARNDAAPIHALSDLADVRVGTVLGYRYPQMEAALGARFRRDDGPSMPHTFDKLLAGRANYAIIEQMTLQYYHRQNPGMPLHTALTFSSFKAPCAVSRTSKVPLEEIDRAIVSMVDDGTVAAVMSHYR
ncbi:MAG: transporter substrate-binding domain-containing protein [Pseudomonadota bacterium]